MNPPSQTAPLSFPRHGLFWNPYFQIFVTILLTAAAQVLLKMGADRAGFDSSLASWMGLRPLAFGWTWLGVATLGVSFISWLYVLRFLPLGLAFGLANGIHIVVPIASWLFLHETIGSLRGGGIAVILAGIVLLARSMAMTEEKG